MPDYQTPTLLTDPIYETDPESGRVVLLAAQQEERAALSFPAEDAGRHLHGWLTALQDIADRTGAVGLGEVAQQMIVLQPTEIAMAEVGPGRAALVFAFGQVKLAFLVATDQLASLIEETRKQEG